MDSVELHSSDSQKKTYSVEVKLLFVFALEIRNKKNLFSCKEKVSFLKFKFPGYEIRGGGVLILGQDQDSVGGSFQANQCFIGELTGVNIWNHVINEQQINHMSKSCLRGVGNVFQWSDFKFHVKGSVRTIKQSC